MTTWVLIVTLVGGVSMTLHYQDVTTCHKEAVLLSKDKKNVASAICSEIPVPVTRSKQK